MRESLILKLLLIFSYTELPFKNYIMPVNPFENHKDAKSSVVGIKETLRHLSDGKPLGCFLRESFKL
jgi:hypothetical protein